MSDIKFDLQLFGGGAAGGSQWTEGITQSAVDAAYDAFSAKIDQVEEAIKNYAAVDAALEAGWSGTDRDAYLEKFHQHAETVCSQIEEYRTAVKNTVEEIKAQWESFQSGLIS